MKMVRLCLSRDFMASEWEESSAVAEVTAAVIVVASTAEETVSEAAEMIAEKETDSTAVATSVVELAVVVATEEMTAVVGMVRASEVTKLRMQRQSMLLKKLPRCLKPRLLNQPPNKNMTKRLKRRRSPLPLPLPSQSKKRSKILLRNLSLRLLFLRQ